MSLCFLLMVFYNQLKPYIKQLIFAVPTFDNIKVYVTFTICFADTIIIMKIIY